MSGPRSAVVVNPIKVADVGEFRRTVEEALSRAGWPAPHWFETTPDEPGTAQAHAAVEGGAEVVFVCGGDGTVRSVVSALVGTDTALAVLPAGTGNLLAANLGLSTDLATGLEIAVEGGLRRLDVGIVSGPVGQGGDTGGDTGGGKADSAKRAVEARHFVVMAGMGFDAHMLAETSDAAKSRIGWLAYVLGALRHLTDRPMRVRIRIDGAQPVRRRARTVLIANVGRLTAGMRLLDSARPDDGLFDVAVLTPRTVRQWAALGAAVLRRRERVPSMEVFRGTRIDLTTERTEPRELDGDVIEPGRHLFAELLPKALWLCVPQPAGHPDLAVDADAAAERAARLIDGDA